MLCYMLRLGRVIVYAMLQAQATCNQIISNKLRCYNTFLLIAKSKKLYLSPIHAHHNLIQYRTFFLDITCAYNFF